jgi:GNAT superfamily N-acetyltransferase
MSMSRVWILNDLFVAPEHRRGGVGRALMGAAEDFGRESGAKWMLLATKNTNAPAKALYEACGWKLDVVFDYYLRFF